MTSSAGLAWSIPATERVKYDQIFEGLQPVSGLLTGDKVKPVLLNSNLPVDVLSRVWELSDIDGDGMLDREEFTVAMHLVYRALEKNPVPPSVPLEMIPPSKRRGSSLPGAVAVLPSAVPGISGGQVIPSVVQVSMSGTASGMPGPVSVMPGASGALTSPTIGSVPSGMGAKWVVGPAEKLKYDEMFRQADTDMDGYVNGAEIKDIFLQSGLPQLILAHIWNLCDTAMIGKLNADQFALAMYLIQQKLLGVEPPTQLLPDMVPPSLRPGTDGGIAAPLAIPVDPAGMKELDVLSKGIDDLKRDKMRLEQDKAQKEADIKIRNGEVMSLQKELDALTNTVKQLELQKGEAQKRLDELDDKRTKLEASVTECKEKYRDEQKQIEDLRYQITNRESIVTNQEVELRKMKDELGTFRQRETDLEQQLDAGQKQVGQMSKKLTDMQTEIEQTAANVRKLQEAEKSLNASIGQYDALLRNEITEEQLTRVEPVVIDSGALTFKARLTASPAGAATNAFGSVAFVDDFKAEPFGAKDPFLDSAADSEADPFQNEDPFGQVGNNGSFQSVDPFVEGADPFGSDPFRESFVPSSDVERPSSAFGAGAAGFAAASSSSSLKTNTLGASGGDPWGAAFPASTAPSFDHFDPFGSGSSSTVKSQMNTIDPFGTGSFEPPTRHTGSTRSASQSPAAPVLPPKQKKAPAPPRPPAPKPASGFPAGGFDLVDAFDGPSAARGGTTSASLSTKNEPAVGFANFSPAKFSSEAEQLAWAKKDSEQEFERLRRIREQEQADLELAIALSKQDSASSFKS